MKTFCAISDLEGLKQMIEPMSTKGVLFGSRASGKSRSDSNYNLLVVSETPEEIKKVTSRHPLGKKLEPMVLTPDEFNSTSGKNKELSKQFDDGIHLWGSTW
jgi:predicted nucleotidyltransferase